MPNQYTRQDRESRFWDALDKAGDCWNWVGSVGHNGYGATHIDGRTLRVHRAAYVYAIGPIPQGMYVLHSCDNRRCCRPEHLFLGDAATNAADMVVKGRSRTGELNNLAKLTWESVQDIRHARGNGVRLRVLAERYGVTMAAISYAARGDTWKDHEA